MNDEVRAGTQPVDDIPIIQRRRDVRELNIFRPKGQPEKCRLGLGCARIKLQRSQQLGDIVRSAADVIRKRFQLRIAIKVGVEGRPQLKKILCLR